MIFETYPPGKLVKGIDIFEMYENLSLYDIILYNHDEIQETLQNEIDAEANYHVSDLLYSLSLKHRNLILLLQNRKKMIFYISDADTV